jgi:hypothetical protein
VSGREIELSDRFAAMSQWRAAESPMQVSRSRGAVGGVSPGRKGRNSRCTQE